MKDFSTTKEALLVQRKEAELREAKRRESHSRRMFETRMKCIIGGTFHSYFPQAYLFDQDDWCRIIKKVVDSEVFKAEVNVILKENRDLWDSIRAQENERLKKEKAKDKKAQVKNEKLKQSHTGSEDEDNEKTDDDEPEAEDENTEEATESYIPY
jgi:hypothetical protein